MKKLFLLALVAAAPPANVTMQNGQPRAVVPTATIDGNGNIVSTTPGTAGSPSNDVTTVQGTPNGTPQNVTSRGAASMATGQVSVGTTATLIVAARALRERLTVGVTTAVQCSYGNAGVTLTTGYPLAAVTGASLTVDTTAALYGVCASTATVGYLEQY